MRKFNELSSEDFAEILIDRKEVEILVDCKNLGKESLKLIGNNNTEIIINSTILNQDNFNLFLINAIELKDMFMINLLSWQIADAKVFCKKHKEDLYKLRIVF